LPTAWFVLGGRVAVPEAVDCYMSGCNVKLIWSSPPKISLRMGETISAATWNWFGRVRQKFRCSWANNITKPCIWKITMSLCTNNWYIHASSFQYNLTCNINNVQCIFNRITCRRNAEEMPTKKPSKNPSKTPAKTKKSKFPKVGCCQPWVQTRFIPKHLVEFATAKSSLVEKRLF